MAAVVQKVIAVRAAVVSSAVEDNLSEELGVEDAVAPLKVAYLYIYAAVLFLLPIKFGSSWLTGNLPAYPDNLLFTSFPTSFLNIAAGLLLIAAVVLFKPTHLNSRSTKIIFFWALLTVSCAAFGYYQANMSFYVNSVNQMLTVTLLAISGAIAIENVKDADQFIIGGLCGGLTYVVLNGAYQYFWGFADTREFYLEQVKQGVQFPRGQANRIMQTLVYSTFTISNSCAAHIILTAPLLVYGVKKYFNPEHSQAVKAGAFMLIIYGCTNAYSASNITLGLITLFIGIIFYLKAKELPTDAYKYCGGFLVFLTFFVLALTRSRAGMICFVFGSVLALLLTVKKGRTKALCGGILLAGVLVGSFVAVKIASFQVRLGYYSVMLKSFLDDIWGEGFGSFASSYNLLKDGGIEESQVPHSFFFGYLGQGGVICGLTVLLCVVGTLFLISKSKMDPFYKFCLLAGLSSWFLHAQLDFNIMIVGTLSSAVIMGLLGATSEASPQRNFRFCFYLLIPCSVFSMYGNIQLISQERGYFYLQQTLKNQEKVATLDEVKNIVDKMAAKKPYSTNYLTESAQWSIGQNLYNREINPIQKFEYLKYAEENLQKASLLNPKQSGIYTSLARVYMYQKNLERSREMLEKAFAVYPYSGSALQLEKTILKVLRQRFPQNATYHEAYLRSQVKQLEVLLGRLRFLNHLKLSAEDENSIMTSLDKTSSQLYTEMDFFDKSGISVDTADISQRINEILNEAKMLVKKP